MFTTARHKSLLAVSLGLAVVAQAGTDAKALDCAKLVPAAVVARVLPGGTVQPFGADERTALCNVSLNGDDFAAQASYQCRPTDTLAGFQAKAEKKPAVPGLGRASAGDGRRVLFYDDDTDCLVEVSDNAGRTRAIALAKELSAVLKPDLLPKVAAGTFSLPCAKLVPEALVKKWRPGGKVEARYVQADQMECKLEGAGTSLTFSYVCRAAPNPNYWADFKEQLKSQGIKEYSDVSIGTGGVYAVMFGMPSVSFTDGETGCLVTVTAIGLDKAKALALTAEVEKALTKESAR